ncbi:MAG: TonB-dependent receptor [Bacteroidales bacterium]|nr:TonB-dependent receptor [Bacteroidales bacterium]
MKSIFLFAFLSVCCAVAHAQEDSIWGIVKNGVDIDEITVKADKSNNEVQMTLPQNVVKLDKKFIDNNFAGSLMQSLSLIPGVQAMTVGSNHSKPVIRGLGFNRLAVIENGIKHQRQQWGHEHGLEVSQFSLDEVEIIKGPAAMVYGSDALGGVISLKDNSLPQNARKSGVLFFFRSNNSSLGLSTNTEGVKGKFFYKFNFTAEKYSDYKVPVDSIQYYSYYIKLKEHRLRNTAGNNGDASLTFGFSGIKFKSSLSVSDVYDRSGFFANAHGIEIRLSKIDFDKSFSDIDYPFSTANHFMAVCNNSLKIGRSTLKMDFAFQNNRREEFSEPVSHGYMPKPDGFLERSFYKNTYSLNAAYKFMLGQHSLQAGFNSEFQKNKSGGWGYVLPGFETVSNGIYFCDKLHISNGLILSAGLRTDFSSVKIFEYKDWYKTPLQNGDSAFVTRSEDCLKKFSSIVFSFGLNYETGNWVLKGNFGKSFRMPLALELGSDGVNYQIFRYERGNNDLEPEVSYQADFGVNFQKKQFKFYLTPFLNYFPNYIYLSPGFNYVEGLQLYEYTQNQVFRFGGEFQADYALSRKAEFSLGGEYLFARQLSGSKKGYGLPFAEPWSVFVSAKYFVPQKRKRNECYVSVTQKYTGSQKDIVPPEKPTDGYFLTSMSLGKKIIRKKTEFSADLCIDNLFNAVYYNHTSYYRLIDVPEAGRNFSIKIGFIF